MCAHKRCKDLIPHSCGISLDIVHRLATKDNELAKKSSDGLRTRSTEPNLTSALEVVQIKDTEFRRYICRE